MVLRIHVPDVLILLTPGTGDGFLVYSDAIVSPYTSSSPQYTA